MDFSTHSVDLCLLDDDLNDAVHIPVPLRGKKESAFQAARNVHAALRLPAVPWESIWLVGIENGFHRSHTTKVAQARIQGAVISSLPLAGSVPIVWLPDGEWKIEVLGRGFGTAKKDVVAAWALGELAAAGVDASGWSQDGLDAYSIARAVRAMNARGIVEASAA